MTRRHQEDIMGKLKEIEGDDWEVLEVPAIENIEYREGKAKRTPIS